MERSDVEAAALDTLDHKFGHANFRAGQLEAIIPLLEQDRDGADVLSVIATASGKVCYISSLGGVRATRSGSCSACVACATATVAFIFLFVSALIRLILLAVSVVFLLHL